MIQTIGVTAGTTWDILQDKGEMSITQLKKATGASAFLLDAAIGWLAREDKIILTKKGNSIKVTLK